MSFKNILILLITLGFVGLGLYWYMGLETASDESVDQMSEEAEESEHDDLEDSDMEHSAPVSEYNESSVKAEDSTDIDNDLDGIDSMFVEDYDDSDLDSTFTVEGSNSLTNTYDY